ncbi:hypothetical protein Tco_0412157 [Tanacetum coccineum]
MNRHHSDSETRTGSDTETACSKDEKIQESHSGSMSSMKNLDDTFNFGDQFLHDKPTEDDQEKSKVREESDSTIPDSSHQTVTSTPPVIPPFTEVSSSKPSLLVTPPPINTEATTITTSLPEITPFIALQLRVARLEQEMSEVRRTDHSVLERHTADLIEKYSVLPSQSIVKKSKNQKRGERPKRKHDSDDDEDDDDDEGPSAGSNQGRSTKKRRSDSAASGSAKPPPKDDDQSLQKPKESDASASKQPTSAFTSTGWQITDTRDAGADSSMHRSDPESEHSEQSSDDISKQDERNDSDMEDTDKRYHSQGVDHYRGLS